MQRLHTLQNLAQTRIQWRCYYDVGVSNAFRPLELEGPDSTSIIWKYIYFKEKKNDKLKQTRKIDSKLTEYINKKSQVSTMTYQCLLK